MATIQPPAGASGRLFDDSFLKFLPAPLREPRRAWLVLPICLVLTLAGAGAIAYLLAAVLPEQVQPDFSKFFGKGFLTVFALAVATPLVETLILAASCSILLRLVRPELAILATSLGWAVAHSYQAPIWGLVIFWPFVIFSTLYVVWKQRSLMLGILMPFAAHFLHNLYPSIMIGFPGAVPSM